MIQCSNFEWAEGYETRFGVTFVGKSHLPNQRWKPSRLMIPPIDYENGQKRYPKKSALELKNVFAKYIGKLPPANEKEE
jgi:beta-glucosidase